VLLPIVAAASPASAAIGTIDDVPAATLLLPYFEVDLDNADHLDTLFSINNASASATLAHVTVWSTWSIPVLDFDVYLTGFDVQTINLGDVLINGVLPRTASVGQDPTDTLSPKGPISQDINFASCTGFLPYTNPAISPSFRTHLRALLTGQKSPVDNTCAGTSYGDNVARGYVTVDVTNACSLLFPSSSGYFVNGGGGIAGNRNILWGDYFYVDQVLAAAEGETLVHVEAAPGTGVQGSATQGNYGPAFGPGDYTFYGRYVAGTAIDNREPLATTFAARYIRGSGFDGGTSLIVWRDSKFPPGASCTTGPNYGELFQSQIVAFDEEENPFTVVQGGPSGEPIPGQQCIFCDEAQRVAVGTELETPFDFGWLYLNLNHATTVDATLGAGYINIAQSWVTVSMTAHQGHYAVGFDAVQLDNASSAVPGGVVLPVTSGIP
jgi:hypothetical protein